MQTLKNFENGTKEIKNLCCLERLPPSPNNYSYELLQLYFSFLTYFILNGVEYWGDSSLRLPYFDLIPAPCRRLLTIAYNNIVVKII